MLGLDRAAPAIRLELGPRPPWWRPFARRRWNRDRLEADRVYRDATMAKYDAMLRGIYTPEMFAEMTNRPNPMFALLKRSPTPGDGLSSWLPDDKGSE
ncbi:MAG: hypothetical protein KBD62_32200 [Kofleriaceae bacterium]|nr:hypothetical protein [Kofleriaceae bacterium]